MKLFSIQKYNVLLFSVFRVRNMVGLCPFLVDFDSILEIGRFLFFLVNCFILPAIYLCSIKKTVTSNTY